MSQSPDQSTVMVRRVDASDAAAINSFASTGMPVLLVSNTSQYMLVYTDKGSGADNDLSIYRPTPDLVPNTPFYILGDAAVGNYSGPTGSSDTVAVLNDDSTYPLLKAPTSYSQVWNDKGSHGDQDGSVWFPVAPDGYVSLGYVGQSGYDAPAIDSYRCVRKDYAVLLSAAPTLIWSDAGSRADEDVSLYAVPGMNNLFVAQGNYQPFAGQVYALKNT